MRQLEFTHQQALHKVQQAIRVEKDGISALRLEIASLRADVAAAADEERLRVEAEVRATRESSERLSEDSGEWQAKLDLLAEQITALQSKEKLLTGELRKKGDLARQIIIGKDEEIAQLRVKVKQGAGSNGDMNDGLNCFQPQPSRSRKGPPALISESQLIPHLDLPTSAVAASGGSGRVTKSPTTPTMVVDIKEQVMDRGVSGGLTRQTSQGLGSGSLAMETEEILSAVEVSRLLLAASNIWLMLIVIIRLRRTTRWRLLVLRPMIWPPSTKSFIGGP